MYFVVFDYATSKFPFTFVREFQALNFRNYSDFVQLLLTGFAFFTLGRQKKLDPFLLALLSIATVGLPYGARFVVRLHSGSGMHRRSIRQN